MEDDVTATPTIERLVAETVPFGDDPLGAEMRRWLTFAPFRRFVESNAPKIRKKLRGAADAEARRDVRAELLVAARIVADRRFTLAWEAYGSGRPGPDFTVRYRDGSQINLEVTRPRRVDGAAALVGPLLTKLHQLPPAAANLVVLAVDAGDRSHAVDVAGAVRQLRQRADAKDEAYFTARGWRDTRTFYDRFLRLGGVVTLGEVASRTTAEAWANPSARIPVPEPSLRAIVAALGETRAPR